MTHPKVRTTLKVLPLLVLLGAGCAGMHAFTPLDRSKSDPHLSEVQFYLSDKMVLSRRVSDRAQVAVSSDHAIRNIRGMEVEEIVLEEGTPAVLVGARGDTLLLSCEPPEAGSERYFRFVPGPRRPAEKSDDPARYWLDVNPGGFVEYGGDLWELARYREKRRVSFNNPAVLDVSRTESDRPYLLVRTEDLRLFDKSSRLLPGRTVETETP
jgi:hypothetical protein